MTKYGLPPRHPGELLAGELKELGMSASAFARALGVSTNRITQILRGQRSISANTSLRLARFFGCGDQFWLNFQKTYDIRLAQRQAGKKIEREVIPLKDVA